MKIKSGIIFQSLVRMEAKRVIFLVGHQIVWPVPELTFQNIWNMILLSLRISKALEDLVHQSKAIQSPVYTNYTVRNPNLGSFLRVRNQYHLKYFMNGRKIVQFYKVDILKRMKPRLFAVEVRRTWMTEPCKSRQILQWYLLTVWEWFDSLTYQNILKGRGKKPQGPIRKTSHVPVGFETKSRFCFYERKLNCALKC